MRNKARASVITLVLLLLFVCVFSSGCVENTDKETYIVSVNPGLQPFSVKSDSGDAEGFDIDMMNWIAEDLGIKFEYEFASLSDYMAKADDGTYDLRTGLIITDARKELLLFSDPYIESYYSLICRKDTDLTTEDVLAGDAKISVADSSAYINWLKNHFGEDKYNQMIESGRIVVAMNVDRSVYMVLAGEADVCICGDIVTVTQSDNYPLLKFLGYLDGTIYNSIAASKNNPELIELINKGLADLRASPYYNELKAKYDIPYKKDVYNVGIDFYNNPFTYLDANGELTGLDYDSIMWIADKYGFDVNFVDSDWTNNVNEVAMGTLDMWYSGMTITDDRSQMITFSTPYLSGNMAVLSKDKVSKADFESGNVVIGSHKGTTNDGWIKYFFGKAAYNDMIADGTLIQYAAQEEMYEALADGVIDCVAVDEIGHDSIMESNGLSLVGIYGGGGDYGVAMRDKDIVLIDIINKGIEEMMDTGVYDELLDKYNI